MPVFEKVEVIGAFWYLTNWIVKSCAKLSSLSCVGFFLQLFPMGLKMVITEMFEI